MPTSFGFRLAGAALAILGAAPFAAANSDQIVIFNGRYPTTVGQANQAANCTVCHTGAPALNAYGQAFRDSAAGPDSPNGLAQIEFQDTDGDNFVNVHEILKFNFPGNAANFPAQANTAPVLGAIGNKNLNEGQTLSFQVTTTDEVTGLNPLLSATNLPPGATFVDNRDRTGTFNWVTDAADGGTYPNVTFTTNDGKLTGTESITISVAEVNAPPIMANVDNQTAFVGELLEFTVTATDPEAGPLTMSVTGLPAGAAFLDNGDGTLTVTWTPGPGDAGTYPGITFTAEDDAAQTDSDTIAILVGEPGALVFSPETPLNTTHATDEVLDYRADLATDGQGNWVAVWYISDTGLVVAQRSSDNGQTWTDPENVSDLDGSEEAPQIATDGAGNWVVVWRSSNDLGGIIGNDYDILFARSEDNGLTWSPAAALNSDAELDGSIADRGANIETDGSVWIATWMTNEDVYTRRSADAGLTWGPSIFIGSGLLESFPDTTAPRLAGDGAGNWILVWSDGTPFAGAPNDVDVQISRSSDGGLTWSAPADLNTNAASDAGDDHLPSIAADRAGNWVAVWRSTDSLGGIIGTDSDILVARSSDNGATWTAPAPLSADAETDGSMWDYAPNIAADPLGTWVTMWHRNGAEILMSYSTNAGVLWSLPVQLNVLDNDTTRHPQPFPDGNGNWLAVWETNENPLDAGFDFDLMIAAYYAPEAAQHSSDTDADNVISLSELLRVIQFYNSAGLGCEAGTEDGFAPNDPDQGCTPHASDYSPQDWDISLSELLRLIQFYNSGGYHPCPEGEDGFCPGV